MSNPVAAAAAVLRSRGFALCKPNRGTKSPTAPGWSTRSCEPADFGPKDLLGLLSGPLSNGGMPGHATVTLDLDTEAVLKMADGYLPATGMIEGRLALPRSHRSFLVPLASIPKWGESAADQGSKAAQEVAGHPGPFIKSFRDRTTNKEVIRFLGTGGQTVCPPARHPSGEVREWEGGQPGEPSIVPFVELWDAVCRLASACGAKVPDVGPMRVTARVKPARTVLERARKYLAKMPGAVSGAGGHNATFCAACALTYGFDLSTDDTLKLLIEDFNPRCEPQWSERELRHKAEDADKVPHDKPRGYLRDSLRSNSGDKGDASGENQRTVNEHTGDKGDGIREGEERIAAWGAPSPLPTMPPVPPFPLDVFPHAVASYWRHAAEALSVPVDYVAVPAMSFLGAASGRARAAEVKPGYAEAPCLWSAVFAPPGSTKSAALWFARAPLARAEARWMDEHRDAMNRFMVIDDRYSKEMKEWKSRGCEGEPPAKPVRPTLRQSTLDDATTEAIAKILNENPRGLIMAKDELIGFVKSLDQYRSGGKGSDKQFYLSAWAGAAAKVNRGGTHDTGPLFVAHPFVAVTGMMCPDSLAELRGENRHGEAPVDGFLDRFLLSFPDPIDAVAETWRTIPAEIEQGYCDVFMNLNAMELVEEPGSPSTVRRRPYFIKFSKSGRDAWVEFTGNIAAKMNALDKSDPFRGVLSKLKGYAARIAAMLWCVKRASGEFEEDAPIDAEIIAGADSLALYFELHAARCLGRGWADGTTRIANRLLDWLSRHPDKPGFARTEAYQALKGKTQRDVKSSESLTPAFKLLTDHHFIRPVSQQTQGRGGPVPEVYVVNRDWIRSSDETIPFIP